MKINPKFKMRSLAGENVVFMQGKVDEETSKLISFNQTSVFLWNSLKDKDFSVEDVAELILSQYEIDKDTALRDAKEWVETLKTNNILL